MRWRTKWRSWRWLLGYIPDDGYPESGRARGTRPSRKPVRRCTIPPCLVSFFCFVIIDTVS